MVLPAVTLFDCLVYGIILAPQLIIQAGLLRTLWVALKALPFLLIKLPASFARDRLLENQTRPSQFDRRASFFEDLVVRCMRYTFSHFPPRVTRVFLTKEVALRWLKYRMIWHRAWSPLQIEEYQDNEIKGLWIKTTPQLEPDIVIYYAHGGGFGMGSSYFYLEFLMAWAEFLTDVGYKRPAIFSLEYTLAPDATFPTQMHEAVNGYKHVLQTTKSAAKVCISGDSAGGALMLSMLLFLVRLNDLVMQKTRDQSSVPVVERPRMAILISPWVMLKSPKMKNTRSDFLDIDMLRTYADQYTGESTLADSILVSPGSCRDSRTWRSASAGMFYFIYGSEEVFAPDIEDLVEYLGKCGIPVEYYSKPGEIHVWPVASVFLKGTPEGRFGGLRRIVLKMREHMPCEED